MPDAAPELVVTIFEAKGTADELERLVKLRDAGVLSPEEFEAAKQKVVSGRHGQRQRERSEGQK